MDIADDLIELLPLHPTGQIQNFLGVLLLNVRNAPETEAADQDDAQQDADQIQLKELSAYRVHACSSPVCSIMQENRGKVNRRKSGVRIISGKSGRQAAALVVK